MRATKKRVPYARRKYRQSLRGFLRVNWARIGVVAFLFGIAGVLGSVIGSGYAVGVLHGGLAVGFFFLVWLVFLAHTGSIWQLAGGWGEDNTRDELKKAKRRRHIWGWVDNVEISDGDIDHLVIAAGGVFALDSKWHARELDSASEAQDARRATRAAGRARSVLLSLQHRVAVTPVVVVWGIGQRSIPPGGVRKHGVDFVAGREVARWLERQRGDALEGDRAAVMLTELKAFRSRVNPH